MKTSLFPLSPLLARMIQGSFLFLLILAVSGCAGYQPELILETSRPQSFPRRVAILPFDSSNPYISGTIISDHFIVQMLQKLPAIDVIERKDLIKILQEQKLSLSGIIRPEKFSKLGSILGVDAVIIGSVQTLETIQSVSGAIGVTVKVLDVTSGKIIWADHQKISYATWSSCEVSEVANLLMEKTAKKMVDRMEKNMGRTVVRQPYSTPNSAQALVLNSRHGY